MATALKQDPVETHGEEGSGPAANVCVVDLGTQSRKRIKRLKRGKGKLMDKVDGIVADLVAENVVPPNAAVVVVVVKQDMTMMDMFDDD